MKKVLSTGIFFVLLVSAKAQSSGMEAEQGVKQETKYYRIDSLGKKKYLTNSKIQRMWNEILHYCPDCINVAQEYNVNIFQNIKYKKASKVDKAKTEDQ